MFEDTGRALWHLGVAFDEDQQILWATGFERPAFRGFLFALDPHSGRVLDRIGGFQKPVSIAMVDGKALVADQRAGSIYAVSGSTIAPICDGLPQPDSLAVAKDLFVTCWDERAQTGSVEQIAADGAHRTVASGGWRPRGIATDGAFRIFLTARNENRVLVVPHP
jgi:hypothetical protein